MRHLDIFKFSSMMHKKRILFFLSYEFFDFEINSLFLDNF